MLYWADVFVLGNRTIIFYNFKYNFIIINPFKVVSCLLLWMFFKHLASKLLVHVLVLGKPYLILVCKVTIY